MRAWLRIHRQIHAAMKSIIQLYKNRAEDSVTIIVAEKNGSPRILYNCIMVVYTNNI